MGFSLLDSEAEADWTKISDLGERRRIQNRIAQRKYRERLKARLERLERRAAEPGEDMELDRGAYDEAGKEVTDDPMRKREGNHVADTTKTEGQNATELMHLSPDQAAVAEELDKDSKGSYQARPSKLKVGVGCNTCR